MFGKKAFKIQRTSSSIIQFIIFMLAILALFRATGEIIPFVEARSPRDFGRKTKPEAKTEMATEEPLPTPTPCESENPIDTPCATLPNRLAIIAKEFALQAKTKITVALQRSDVLDAAIGEEKAMLEEQLTYFKPSDTLGDSFTIKSINETHGCYVIVPMIENLVNVLPVAAKTIDTVFKYPGFKLRCEDVSYHARFHSDFFIYNNWIFYYPEVIKSKNSKKNYNPSLIVLHHEFLHMQVILSNSFSAPVYPINLSNLKHFNKLLNKGVRRIEELRQLYIKVTNNILLTKEEREIYSAYSAAVNTSIGNSVDHTEVQEPAPEVYAKFKESGIFHAKAGYTFEAVRFINATHVEVRLANQVSIFLQQFDATLFAIKNIPNLYAAALRQQKTRTDKKQIRVSERFAYSFSFLGQEARDVFYPEATRHFESVLQCRNGADEQACSSIAAPKPG